MARMYLDVYDRGTTYLINKAFTAEKTALEILPDTIYIEIFDTSVFSFIVQTILENKIIQLPKDISEPLIEDFIIDITDELEIAKTTAEIKIKSFLNERLGNISIYRYFEYSELNNKLIDAGFIITDANREEKYLEILETGDEELISLLEVYLNTKDKISEHTTVSEQTNTTIEEIEIAGTVDEVTTLVDNFFTLFN